jgi:hypothetical protein
LIASDDGQTGWQATWSLAYRETRATGTPTLSCLTSSYVIYQPHVTIRQQLIRMLQRLENA